MPATSTASLSLGDFVAKAAELYQKPYAVPLCEQPFPGKQDAAEWAIFKLLDETAGDAGNNEEAVTLILQQIVEENRCPELDLIRGRTEYDRLHRIVKWLVVVRMHHHPLIITTEFCSD